MQSYSSNLNPFTNGAVLSALFLSVIYLTFSLFDPFGIKRSASLQSEAVFNRLISGPWYQSDAQNKITVVLVDDGFVAKQREQWPLSYPTQEWLLSTLLSYKPKAIYFDFLYRQRHHEGESLGQYGDALNAAAERIPIFLPMLVDAEKLAGSCEPALRKTELTDVSEVINFKSAISEIQDTKALKTYLGWNRCGEQYPAMLYGNAKLATPAYALYKAVCESDPTYVSTCKDAHQIERFKEPMIIVWGTGASDQQQVVAKASRQSCVRIDKNSVLSKLKYQAAELLDMVLDVRSKSTSRGSTDECAYTDTLPAMWLDTTRPNAKKQIQKLIKDRVVLVGAKVDGVPDIVTNPVNGTVPGVYLFGMALDNYLSFGAKYFRSSSASLNIWLEALLVFAIFILIATIWRWLVRSRHSERTGTYSMADVRLIVGYFVGFRIVIPLFLGLLIPFFFWWLGRLPMDWLSLITISFVANPVFVSEIFEDRASVVVWRVMSKYFSF